MDIASLLLGLALLLVVVFIVARPLIESHELRQREPGPADDLWYERERILLALRDLDFDYATGKLLDDDYLAPRAELVAQGAAILRQLDALGASPPPAVGHAPAANAPGRAARKPQVAGAAPRPARDAASNGGDAEAEIERAIARLRDGRGHPPSSSADTAADAEIEAAAAQRRSSAQIAGVNAAKSAAPAATGGNAAGAGAATQPPARPQETTAVLCPECSTPAQPGQTYCGRGGAALPRPCAHCGRAARPGDQFCAGCGQPLNPASNPRQVGAGG